MLFVLWSQHGETLKLILTRRIVRGQSRVNEDERLKQKQQLLP
jgi:hypothetical protein